VAETSLRITSDTLTPGIKEFPAVLDRTVAQTIDYFAPRVEAFMKSNAPWTDRTTNARNGLRATPEHSYGRSHSIHCTHGVPYGIWLETRFGGKNAIIDPTIESQGHVLMSLMRKLLRRAR
jgi:hypothetical protein